MPLNTWCKTNPRDYFLGLNKRFSTLPTTSRFLSILQIEKTGEATLSLLLQTYALFYMGCLESNKQAEKKIYDSTLECFFWTVVHFIFVACL